MVSKNIRITLFHYSKIKFRDIQTLFQHSLAFSGNGCENFLEKGKHLKNIFNSMISNKFTLEDVI